MSSLSTFSLSTFLKQIRDKSLFDDSLLEVDKELPYGVFSDDPTHEDNIKASFNQLINNLALDNILPFAAKAYDNIALGKKLNGIHPLTTFGYFLSDEQRDKIYHIYDQSRCQTSLFNPYGWVFAYLRDESIKSHAYLLKIRHERGEIVPHLDEFAKKSSLDSVRLIEIINEKENENRYLDFIKYILDKKSLEAK
ncbi:MAG: hypothetical protein K1000chlam1_01064 [Candidatus Anoxychlamydiales bacterium]|nr:hypothetical protein [Candidatus Anoxychlamydiales bacterium]